MTVRSARLATAIGIALVSGSTHADPPRPPPPIELEAAPATPIDRALRWPLLVGESALILGAPTVYYWSTTSLQKEDWELDWDWASWRMKLTSFDAVSLDTGNWVSNALRHPYAGALSYQAGRANGFGVAASTLIDFVGSTIWEYVVEYKERISLNDLVVNTMSGFLLGEPLFQLGLLGDQPGASRARRTMAFLASPFHRLHSAAGYGSWKKIMAPWVRLEVGVGAGVGGHGTTVRNEAILSLDLEVVSERTYGTPGVGTVWTRAGTFSRLAAEMRADALGEPSLRVQSRTTYAGSYARAIDGEGRGSDRFVGAGAGIDYDTRRLAEEWDRMAVFHVAGPRLALGRWTATTRTLWEVAAYADLGMIQAHVFGPVPPFPPTPQTSVLQTRGYYFARGTTLATRLRVQGPTWTAELEGRAHALWSIDNLDRVELNGGQDDPHDVADQRLVGRATLGVMPGAQDLRLELAIEGVMRRGTWSVERRTTAEISAEVGVVTGF